MRIAYYRARRFGRFGLTLAPTSTTAALPTLSTSSGTSATNLLNTTSRLLRSAPTTNLTRAAPIPISMPTPDPCTGVICPPGHRCDAGVCVGPCTGVICPPGTHCENGVCVPDREAKAPTEALLEQQRAAELERQKLAAAAAAEAERLRIAERQRLVEEQALAQQRIAEEQRLALERERIAAAEALRQRAIEAVRASPTPVIVPRSVVEQSRPVTPVDNTAALLAAAREQAARDAARAARIEAELRRRITETAASAAVIQRAAAEPDHRSEPAPAAAQPERAPEARSDGLGKLAIALFIGKLLFF